MAEDPNLPPESGSVATQKPVRDKAEVINPVMIIAGCGCALDRAVAAADSALLKKSFRTVEKGPVFANHDADLKRALHSPVGEVRKHLREQRNEPQGDSPADMIFVCVFCRFQITEGGVFLDGSRSENDNFFKHKDSWPILESNVENKLGTQVPTFRTMPRLYFVVGYTEDASALTKDSAQMRLLQDIRHPKGELPLFRGGAGPGGDVKNQERLQVTETGTQASPAPCRRCEGKEGSGSFALTKHRNGVLIVALTLRPEKPNTPSPFAEGLSQLLERVFSAECIESPTLENFVHALQSMSTKGRVIVKAVASCLKKDYTIDDPN